MTGSPAVSVLMAVFNGERYLRQALESILSQSFTDFELVVVDDASRDRSPAILRECRDGRLRVLTNAENAGLTKSLNRGLAAARGRFVARQDADDLSRPDRLGCQVAFLDAHPEIALVGSAVRVIDERGTVRRSRDVRPASAFGVEWALLFGNPFVHSSVMFRRDVVVSELGGYDESCEFNQDFELWSRLAEGHRATNLPDPLVSYRAHPSSIVGQRDERVRASRLRNVTRNIAIQQRNIVRILGRDDLARDWAPLWTSLNVGWLTGKPADPERALDLLLAMHEAFSVNRPGAQADADVSAGFARVASHVACELAPTRRAAAIAAWRRAAQASPRVAAAAMPVFAARLLGGDRGARIVRRLRMRLPLA